MAAVAPGTFWLYATETVAATGAGESPTDLLADHQVWFARYQVCADRGVVFTFQVSTVHHASYATPTRQTMPPSAPPCPSHPNPEPMSTLNRETWRSRPSRPLRPRLVATCYLHLITASSPDPTAVSATRVLDSRPSMNTAATGT